MPKIYIQNEGSYIYPQPFSALNFIQKNSLGVGTDTLTPIANPSNPTWLVDIQTQDLWGYVGSGSNAPIFRLSDVGIGTTNPKVRLQINGVVGFGTFDNSGISATNIRIGDNTTGSNLTTGYDNIFIGLGAGNFTTTGYSNNFLGYTAGYGNTSGYNNVAIGRSAGYSNTTGNNNNFFGDMVGYGNTTGNHNNFFGQQSGRCNTSGSSNNFFGVQSGTVNTTGNNNNFFGPQTGRNNTSGTFNNFIGYQSGYCNTTGSQNNFLGLYAGFNNTGSGNNFIGSNAGCRSTSGGCNNFFGSTSGFNNTTGGCNNFFGYQSGYCNTTGGNNIFLGHNTGISTSSSNKIIIGRGFNASNLFDSPSTTKDTQLAIGTRTSTSSANYWIVGDENFNVGVGTTNPTSKLTVNGDIANSITSYGSSTSSTATLSPVAIHSTLSSSVYRSVDYFIQATTGTRYQAVKLLSVHDGTSTYNTVYGNVFSNNAISTYSVDISSGNIRLVATPSTSATVTYKINYTVNRN
jgi:hypothetical protein